MDSLELHGTYVSWYNAAASVAFGWILYAGCKILRLYPFAAMMGTRSVFSFLRETVRHFPRFLFWIIPALIFFLLVCIFSMATGGVS